MFFVVIVAVDFCANNDVAAAATARRLVSQLLLFGLFFDATQKDDPSAATKTVVGSRFGGRGWSWRGCSTVGVLFLLDTVWPRVGFPFLRH